MAIVNSSSQKPHLATDSPVKLTQFTPLSSEIRPSIGPFSLSRLFRRSKSDTPEPISKAQETILPLDESELIKKEKELQNSGQGSSEFPKEYWKNAESMNVPTKPILTVTPPVETVLSRDRERDIVYTRSLTNVLRRISSIRDKRGQMPQSYKDSDFKQYWMPDNNCKECYECGDKFTTFRRRHHCRVCGQIFCSRCCNQEIPGKIMGYTGDLRVCTHCCRIVLSYIQSSDLGADLHTLQEDLHNKLSMLNTHSEYGNQEFGSRCSLRRKTSVGFREEDFTRMRSTSSSDISSFSSTDTITEHMTSERRILVQDSIHLREIWLLMQHPLNGIEFQNHWHRLRNYPNCIVGTEIVDWLISMDKASNRQQAAAIGQALTDAKLLEPLTNQEQVFQDEYALYRVPQLIPLDSPALLDVTSCESLASEEIQDPLWVKEIAQDDDVIENSGKIENCSMGVINHHDVVSPDYYREESKMHTSASMFYLDMNFRENRVSVFKPRSSAISSWEMEEARRELVSSVDQGVQLIHEDTSHTTINDEFLKGALSTQSSQPPGEEFVAPLGWHNREHLSNDNEERLAYDRLAGSYHNHEQLLLAQLLSSEGLSNAWMDTIFRIVRLISRLVRPDVKNDNDDMDIRQYVQFKKIPSGTKNDCNIISGIVCTKSVAHKKMLCKISNPNILILACPIVYQRQENKFLSLEPLVMQEYSYLRNVISKIASFKPDIVLVEKTVSRLAQDFLLEHGITLVLNVKPSVMERVARCTQGHIVTSIDAQINKPQLGMCHSFRVIDHILPNGKTKTLMYFDGCAAHLGCTVTLRGANNVELRKVKKVTQFMVFVAYNWRLERSYLMDEFVLPPPLPEENQLSIITDQPDVDEKPVDNDTSVNPRSTSISSTDEIPRTSNVAPKETEVDNDVTSIENFRKLDSQFVDDFSDPLHAFLNSEFDDSSTISRHSSELHVSTVPLSNAFRRLLDDIILCASPNIKHSVPYLESDAGRHCILRRFFPSELYWSAQLRKETNAVRKSQLTDSLDDQQLTYDTVVDGMLSDNIIVQPTHAFMNQQLTMQMEDDTMSRNLLADFRARGGRIKKLCAHEQKEKSFKGVRSSKDVVDSGFVSNSALLWERKIDALDPFYHQRLVVLLCSYSMESNNAPNFCVSPRLVNMDFYGCNDITLGGFLERYCFRPTYTCGSQTCETPMTNHIRKFAHENGCVHIVLRQMENPSPLCQNTIVVWSWCRKCGHVTPRVPLSLDAWSLSFAKYLELRFHGTQYLRRGVHDCSHLLHHDYYQYFGYKQRVVAFKYSPITLREIALPPPILSTVDPPLQLTSIIDQIKELAVNGNGMYSSVLEWLIATRAECTGTKYEQILTDLVQQLHSEQCIFREKIEEIQIKLTSPSVEHCDQSGNGSTKASETWKINDCVVNVKRFIAEAVMNWNARVQDFIQQRKKEEKAPKSTGGVSRLISNSGSTVGTETMSPKSQDDILEVSSTPPIGVEKNQTNPDAPGTLSNASSTASFCVGSTVTLAESGQWDDCDVSRSGSEDVFEERVTDTPSSVLPHSGSDPLILEPVTPNYETPTVVGDEEIHKSESRGHERSRSEGDGRLLSGERLKPLANLKSDDDGIAVGKVETKLGSVKTMLSQLLNNSNNFNLPLPLPSNEHYLLPRCEKIPVVVYEAEVSSIVAYALSSADYEHKLQEVRHTLLLQRDSSVTNSPAVKRKNLKMPDKDSSFNGSTDQSSLTDSGASGRKSGMLAFFRGNERNSTRSVKSQSQSPAGFDSVLYSAVADNDPDALELEEDVMTDRDLPMLSGTDVDKTKTNSKKLSDYHVDIEFADSTSKFFCRVYFAEQFRKLRKMVFPQGEETYIRSLSRCVSWQAKGGKSGLTFCKTLDDRFILKQMSRAESQSFPEFGPYYFQYIKKSFDDQKPTAIAKIVGVYRIGYSYSQTNSASKMDLIVMENLFYGRNITQKFDLKGSMRNRLVNTAGKQEGELVLLDENLLKMACENPLYTRPHSKTVLIGAVKNDAQFLSRQLVMDYSLLVGIDDAKHELVVGIIDYIRTFTWDKKIEMVVKGGILNQGESPTIVSPELYRKRFCEAMDRYFLNVPDRWTGLGQGVDFL